MHRSVSSFLSNQAEAHHNGRVPAETKAFIRDVAAAERQMDIAAGPIETARQTLVHAYTEFGDAYGYLRAMDELAASNPGDPLVNEARQRARAEVLNSLEWLEAARLKMSQAIRQAQFDASAGGHGGHGGRAA